MATITQSDVFWKMYKETLSKHDHHFYISSEKHWAVINRPTANWNDNIVSMDFLVRKRVLRINAFLCNDAPLFERLISMKSEIEASLGFKPVWAHGEKGENTYRIKVELPIIPYDLYDYAGTIEKSIPIVQRYIKTFKPYILC